MASNAGTNAALNAPELGDNEDPGLTPPPPGSDPAPSAASKLPGAPA